MGLIVLGVAVWIVGLAFSHPVGAGILAVGVGVTWFGLAGWARQRRQAREAAELAAAERHRLDQWRQHEHQLAVQAEEVARRQHEQQAQEAVRVAEEERRRQERWAHLLGTYGEQDARRIWAGELWIGCSADVVREMFGSPEDIDTKVLKTKTKSIYKYRHISGNRYGLRVYLDDDEVTGWEEKD